MVNQYIDMVGDERTRLVVNQGNQIIGRQAQNACEACLKNAFFVGRAAEQPDREQHQRIQVNRFFRYENHEAVKNIAVV